MRRVLFALVFLVSGTSLAAPAGPDSVRVERLAALGRVWGTAKFFHPALAYRDIDWDRAVLEAIPRVGSAGNERELQQAFDTLLSFLDDPASRTWSAEDQVAASVPPAIPAERPAVEPLTDDFVRVVGTDYDALLGGGDAPSLDELLAACRDARGIVLDLRNRSRRLPGRLASTLEQALPVLLAEDLPLSAPRTRMHSGYPPQQRASSGGYETGVFQREHAVLAGRADRAPPPIVAIVNEYSGDVPEVLGPLQCAGLVSIIQEGERAPWAVEALHWIAVSESVSVTIRYREQLDPDGAVGFFPDLITEEADAAHDPALEGAVAILRGDENGRAVRVPAPPVRRFPEKPYADLEPVPREYRLLGLFRMWNIVRLFYPYHDLVDEPWEDALVELLPRFEAAETTLDYLRAARVLAARMQDSHANAWGRGISPFGTSYPGLMVRRIEGRWIVEAVVDSALASAVTPGDRILSVDGEPSEERALRIAPYMSASTPQALDWKISWVLLAGEEGSDAVLEVERADGSRVTVTAPREGSWGSVRNRAEAGQTLPVFGILPEGFGYIDLGRLERNQVFPALETVAGTPGLIFDLRGYPRSTLWDLGPALATEPVIAVRIRRAVLVGPEPYQRWLQEFEQRVEPRHHWDHDGPVVVLINEEAMSQAEHTCLHLEAALGGDVTFVGTPTNGTDGDVTDFPIPGGFTVQFTGQAMRHGDGRQLQRVGVQPDVLAAPTIEGIRRGEDEALSAAIRFLRDAK